MRDLLLILIVLGLLPLILARPYVGILVWYWLGLMNPHKLTWGFAYNFPFAQLVAIVFLVSFVFSREPKRLPVTRETIILILFLLWMLITTLLSSFPEQAWQGFDKVGKIQLFVILTLIVMRDPVRINLLVWVVVLSIGYYALKGGLFTILTGGGYRVWGPATTFIGGNNELGLAMNMTLPLMRYLQLTFSNRWYRLAMWGAMILTVFAILGTQSRGALLGLIAMTTALVLKTRKRFMFIVLMAFALPMSLLFMPDTWWERMGTIRNYQEDGSAMSRISTWNFILTEVVPERPIVGVGFDALPLLTKYDAHSIYFEVLAEHGIPGLVMFVLLGIFAFRTARRTAKLTKNIDELKWAGDLSAMVQTALVGYAVSGVFLGLAYFDLYYLLLALLILTRVHVDEYLRAREPEAVPQGPRLRRPRRAVSAEPRRRPAVLEPARRLPAREP